MDALEPRRPASARAGAARGGGAAGGGAGDGGGGRGASGAWDLGAAVAILDEDEWREELGFGAGYRVIYHGNATRAIGLMMDGQK